MDATTSNGSPGVVPRVPRWAWLAGILGAALTLLGSAVVMALAVVAGPAQQTLLIVALAPTWLGVLLLIGAGMAAVDRTG